MFRNKGYCYCCASTVEFVATSDWWRDDYRCTKCDSIPRERAVMYCMEKFLPKWRNLSIHELSPVLGRGANRRLAKEAPAYITSQYYAGVAPATIVNGVRCENLEHLTFDNETLDLHITQDVFEHLFNPLPLSVKLPGRFDPAERMSLRRRSCERTSRLDFVHPWRLTGVLSHFSSPTDSTPLSAASVLASAISSDPNKAIWMGNLYLMFI